MIDATVSMSDNLQDSAVPDGEPDSGAEQTAQRKLHRARRAVATIPPPRVRGVLVVEDDPDLQWLLARTLTVRGNRVVGTSSGEGALELMAQWPVDLVLVDDTLPGMSGAELALRLAELHPETPVVMMSSEEPSEDPSAQSAGDLVGAVATIMKPFRPEALVELLRSFPKGEPDLA